MPYRPVDALRVNAWGAFVGAIAHDPTSNAYVFAYSPQWKRRNIELDPVHMPVHGPNRYQFRNLPVDTYRGLPAIVADSLPDTFGNAITDAALAREGVDSETLTALDRLAYLGSRGMGALEYVPSTGPRRSKPTAIRLNELVTSARDVLTGNIGHADSETHAALMQLIQVGISAGGARAKATVWWNPATRAMTTAPDGNQPDLRAHLIKLDGVSEEEKKLAAPRGYGRIEYAYYKMATTAGISMAPSHLVEEGRRAHFITQRFDRDDTNKLHLASLCALGHLDFKQLATHDYTQYLNMTERLNLTEDERGQAFRRIVFNVLAVNRDDHTKNFAFLLDQSGKWQLAPAYDLTHAYKPGSNNSEHLMSVNGKFTDITDRDLLTLADQHEIPHALEHIKHTRDVVTQWPTYAKAAGVHKSTIEKIATNIGDLAPR